MFRKLDKKLFEDGYESESIVKLDSWKDEDLVANDLADSVGYYDSKKGKYRYWIMVLDNDLNKWWVRITAKQFKALKRLKEHQAERVAEGASYRDSWNVDMWFTSVVPALLEKLDENSHGFPPCMQELHRRIIEEVEGKKYRKEKKYAGLSHDDFFNTMYHDDLKRLVFLLREANEDTCLQKNPYEFKLKMVFKPVEGNPKYKKLDFEGSEEDKRETELYRKREYDLANYRSECLHKAIKMFNILIEYLWD